MNLSHVQFRRARIQWVKSAVDFADREKRKMMLLDEMFCAIRLLWNSACTRLVRAVGVVSVCVGGDGVVDVSWTKLI